MKTQRYSFYASRIPPKPFDFREKWGLIAPVVGAIALFLFGLCMIGLVR